MLAIFSFESETESEKEREREKAMKKCIILCLKHFYNT